jgi:methyl-accepting chemotaxis protein
VNGESGQRESGDVAPNVHAVDEQVHNMAATAASQRDGARSLHTLGDQTNSLAEELLLAVGTFRFAMHEQAARDVARFLPQLLAVMPDRRKLERLMTAWLRAEPCFELLYVTDERGRQIVDNIGRRGEAVHCDPAGYDRDWSQRPWFQGAMRLGGAVHLSDIYRSTATQDFCFTAAMAIRHPDGEILGVMAADVNFQKLVTGGGARRLSFSTPPRPAHGPTGTSPRILRFDSMVQMDRSRNGGSIEFA